MNLVSPVFFSSNRVCCTYKCGGLLDAFLDSVPLNEENFSEEWLASVEPSPQNPQEGISEVIDETGFGGTPLPEFFTANADSVFGADFIIRHGRTFPLQLRLIDTSERLPIQCIPAAPELGGKPKTWIVIGTDEADGAEPCIMLGFKEGITPELIAEAAQLDDGRLEMMTHSIPVKAGDAFFIPPGLPHAIGSGILLYEVQPVDNPSVYLEEKFRGDGDKWTPAGEIATYTKDDLLREVQSSNHILKRSDEGFCCELIGMDKTSDFLIWRAEVVSKMEIKLPRPFAMVLCTGGEGNISYAGGTRELKKGDFFLQPFGVPWIEYNAYGRLSLIITMPPK